MILWPWFILVVVYGACVGSFLNVVIYRLPAGKSLIKPASHCPRCGHALAWYDNIPVLGWLLLRGRCRYCQAAISAQYPLVELITALLFGGLFAGYYHTDLRLAFTGPAAALPDSWPTFLVHACLLGALLAATVIDARHFIIPLGITWTITALAWIVLPAAAIVMPGVARTSFGLGLHATTGALTGPTLPLGLVFGALGGWSVGLALLKLKVIPLSFADEQDALAPGTPGTPAAHEPQAEAAVAVGRTAHLALRVTVGLVAAAIIAGALAAGAGVTLALVAGMLLLWGATVVLAMVEEDRLSPEEAGAMLMHPCPRREVMKELLFVGWPVVGALIGDVLLPSQLGPAWAVEYQLGLQVLATGIAGYFVGAGLIWLTRILGTLAFGREAMGLGDVHLLGAIGAVLGWKFALFTFLVAPFLGLLGALVAYGVSRLARGQVRVIPYGPYLAGAAIVLMLLSDQVF